MIGTLEPAENYLAEMFITLENQKGCVPITIVPVGLRGMA
jgi:hypothetical protein